jgi:hypothetical protein
MQSNCAQQLSIETSVLTAAACKAIGRKDVSLVSWQAEPIRGGIEQGSTLYRLSGVCTAAEERVPWRMVLKFIRPGPGNSGDPQAAHYWKREPLYFKTRLLDDLPGGLRAPSCYAVLEYPDSYWLFLEEVHDAFDSSLVDHGWPFEYYRTAARCLGQFNGAYLAGKTLPEADWIPRNWLKAYLDEATPNVNLYFQSADDPFFRHSFPMLSDLFPKAWDERYEILETLDHLPQVFCHQDAFCRNLFAQNAPDTGEKLVAVDWSYAGPAAIGSELSALVVGSIALGTLPFSSADQLAEMAIEAYLEGLKDAGIREDPDLVRFAFAAVAFWRYTFVATLGEMTPHILDEKHHPFLLEIFNTRSMDEIAESLASGNAWFGKLYEDSHRLIERHHL